MAEVKVGLRYNNDTDEVELTVDGEVALSSGKDVFESWVKAYTAKYPPAPTLSEESVTFPGPVVAQDVTVAEPVEPKVVDPAEPVQEPVPEEVEEQVEVEVDKQ